MKILSIAILSLSFGTYAKTISLNGTFENADGCRVWNAYCLLFEGHNTCQFEVYQNGEYVTSLGKGGKVESYSGNTLLVKDVGFRSGYGLPTYVNTEAEIKIKKSYKDPQSYADRDVIKFDLKVTNGVLNRKIIECKNLIIHGE